jgi:hypothetical protein
LKKTTLALLVALSLSLTPVLADAQQPSKPLPPLCYAFSLDGDLNINCGGKREKITHLADVEDFAVDPRGLKLVLIRHQARVQGRGLLDAGDGKPEYYYSHSALQVVLLSGKGQDSLSPLKWPIDLYATCGTVLGITRDPSAEGEFSDLPTVFDDISNGGQVTIDPYQDFRCSADRKTVAGRADLLDATLRIGAPPDISVAGTEGKHPIRYDVSPDGKYVAYNFPREKALNLCVYRTETQKAPCVDEAFWQKLISVADTGEVLYETLKLGDCYYKGEYRVSTTPLPGYDASNACQVIAYWRSGLGEPRIVEPLGAQPQWISPATASALRAWRARSTAAK